MPIQLWTVDDDQIICQRYANEGASPALQAELKRTRKSIVRRANELGLSYRMPPWTQEEDDMLRAHYGRVIAEEMSALLGGARKWQAILARASTLGLTDPGLWSTEEDQVLRDFYPDGRWKIIYQRLPKRNLNAIRNRIALLGVAMKPEAKQRAYRESQVKRGHRVFPTKGKVIGAVISHALAGAESRKMSHTVLDGSEDNMCYLDVLAGEVCALSGLPLRYATRARDVTATASLDRIDSAQAVDR